MTTIQPDFTNAGVDHVVINGYNHEVRFRSADWYAAWTFHKEAEARGEWTALVSPGATEQGGIRL